ncbi:hypothetical protein TRVA0_028S00320 [Trichomonascus vanleenenianus]|uniref:uncharacterized protein n=1 Tax=Trichomonascus vanleenenianus TaxID=2268995 RepID=UPI003ECB59FC
MDHSNSNTSPPSITEKPYESDQANDANEFTVVQEKRWYNTGLKIFGKQLPAYNAASVQLLMVSIVFFLTPGMFNALSGLGGSGLGEQYHQTAANSNVALYCTFATIGFFSGTIVNTLGPRITLAIGGVGYALNSASLLCFNHTQNTGFVIAAGAILGVCAACLWSAQGVVIMAYPTEKSKGKYVAIFWAIFNLGSVIGSLIPLGQSLNDTNQGGVSDGTYAAFLALMIVGSILALSLMPINKVIKSDGTGVIVKKNPTFVTEMKGLFKLLKVDPYVVLLFPMFFCSNWFYTYQFNVFNLAKFNVRTRSLNSLLYWTMQIVGALSWGLFLDWEKYNRKTRAKVFHAVVFVLTFAIWGGGYAFQKDFTRQDVTDGKVVAMDWTDGRKYIGPMFLYMFYGFYDAVWQTYVYWLLGALTNSSRKLGLYAGFYKGIQSAGSAIVWRLDAMEVEYMSLFASSWGLLAASLVISLPLVLWRVKESTDFEDDVMFTEDLDNREEIAEVVGEWVAPGVEVRDDQIIKV